MEGHSTKERALAAALELFGRKGYDGVSMNDIAQAVGVRAPSLYKHFEGKEALFAAVAPEVRAHYQTLWGAVGNAHSQLEQEVQTLGTLSAERLEGETLAWVQRERTEGKGFRAFAGQWSEGIQWLWDEPLKLYERLFGRLIAAEAMKRGDPHVMAVEYLAPILHLIALSDRAEDRQTTAVEEIRKHTRQFHRVFAVRERPAGGGIARGLFRR